MKKCDYKGAVDISKCHAYDNGYCQNLITCNHFENQSKAQDLLREIAVCGISDSDPELKRISWIEVQVERELWDRIQEAVR